MVRHAQPRVASGICYGALDVAADAAATREAARALAVELPEGLAVACSPLRRCRQLAQALLALRPDLAVTLDPRLAEMDFGTWEGRHWDDIGEAALSAWTADFADHRPGGGESVRSFMTRVNGAWQQHGRLARDAAWLTHAGVARAATWLARGAADIPDAGQWPLEAPDFGGWTLLHR